RGDYPDVVQAYSQLTLGNSSDSENWLGLIQASIAAHDAKQALTTAQRIPAAVQSTLETRADYLSLLGLAYYDAKQPDEGTRMLRRAMDAARIPDNSAALNALLRLAGNLREQGRTEAALAVYRQAAELHPDNVHAWEGLVGAYARTHDYVQAKTAVRSMPQSTYE